MTFITCKCDDKEIPTVLINFDNVDMVYEKDAMTLGIVIGERKIYVKGTLVGFTKILRERE
jgi:hypothetical protein